MGVQGIRDLEEVDRRVVARLVQSGTLTSMRAGVGGAHFLVYEPNLGPFALPPGRLGCTPSHS